MLFRSDAMKGTKWDERFLKMAEDVATWSSCYQSNRQVGAVIAKNKRILTTGYNGASAGIESCKDRGYCIRKKLGIASGTRHEICSKYAGSEFKVDGKEVTILRQSDILAVVD